MKNLGLWIGLGVVVMIGIAIVSAGQMGTTSHAFARGKIVLKDGLEGKASAARTLFITVFDQDIPRPPFGAMRTTLKEPPQKNVYDFIITKDRLEIMRPGAPWPTKVRIKARLDQDGRAGPDMPGDLWGEVNAVTAGAKDLTITIDKVVGM